jgi:putative endonuclease
MFFVYVIVSETKGLRFYVGLSANVDRRIAEHNSGKTRSTKGYRPWKFFFSEEFPNRVVAREREKYYKSGSGKESIKIKWFRSSTG